MRRSLILGFLVVVLLLEGGARLLAPHIPGQLLWDNQFTQDKADQIDRAGQVDVVFIGSSVVNAGIDSGFVGEESRFSSGYNAAIPSTTPSTWKVWSRDLVWPDLCPEVVVIGISIRDYNDANPGISYDLREYLPSAGRLGLYGQFSWASLEQQVGRFSTFVRIRSRLREPENVARYLVWGRTPGWPVTVLTDGGRFQGFDNNVYQVPTQAGLDQLAQEVFVNFSVGGNEDRAVRAMIEDATGLGMRVVVVRMPTLNEELSVVLPDGMADVLAFEEAIGQLGVDYNIPVIRYVDMDDDRQFFSDLYHLNLSGTELLSRRLGSDLQRLFPEPTEHRCGIRPAEPEVAGRP
ncbi:MAG: hypothetical protein JJE47_11335 [Acidimicrobiia bacterium]|nr:hypothetical protein [Acidimicrobiia bacterium]